MYIDLFSHGFSWRRSIVWSTYLIAVPARLASCTAYCGTVRAIYSNQCPVSHERTASKHRHVVVEKHLKAKHDKDRHAVAHKVVDGVLHKGHVHSAQHQHERDHAGMELPRNGWALFHLKAISPHSARVRTIPLARSFHTMWQRARRHRSVQSQRGRWQASGRAWSRAGWRTGRGTRC